MVSVDGWSIYLLAAFTIIIVFIIVYAGNLVKEKGVLVIFHLSGVKRLEDFKRGLPVATILFRFVPGLGDSFPPDVG